MERAERCVFESRAEDPVVAAPDPPKVQNGAYRLPGTETRVFQYMQKTRNDGLKLRSEEMVNDALVNHRGVAAKSGTRTTQHNYGGSLTQGAAGYYSGDEYYRSDNYGGRSG